MKIFFSIHNFIRSETQSFLKSIWDSRLSCFNLIPLPELRGVEFNLTKGRRSGIEGILIFLICLWTSVPVQSFFSDDKSSFLIILVASYQSKRKWREVVEWASFISFALQSNSLHSSLFISLGRLTFMFVLISLGSFSIARGEVSRERIESQTWNYTNIAIQKTCISKDHVRIDSSDVWIER